ncbi:MAG: class I SAM-dependent methyltransferase [Nocardioidaceae bacterium]|nr:class I SAM-dependent methyltransferase [Nocardioidaceae bacterium]
MTDGPGYYAHLTFNAPLSEHRADAIAQRLAAHEPADALDVGCGWGELLLRVLVHSPSTMGTGVDTDQRLLARAAGAADARGLTRRTVFAEVPATDVHDPADLVICVGSSHALDEDPAVALGRLRGLVRPGGRLLLGEGFWEPRGPVDTALVWDDVLALPDLGGLVDRCVAAGFRPLYVERANADEWVAFESSYLADVEEWLMSSPEGARAEEERTQADDHRRRWLHGYRNGLGFAYLTLGVPV